MKKEIAFNNSGKGAYLVITPFFPSYNNFRGSFIYDQCVAIERNSNYKVIIFKPKSFWSRDQDYEYNGFKVYRFKTINLPSNLFPGLFNSINIQLLNFKISKTIKDKSQLKIVHFHGIHSGFLSKALRSKADKIKVVLQFHGLDVLGFNQGKFKNFELQKNWILYMAKKTFSYINLHVGVSQKTLENLNSYISIKPNNQFILYNGVDKKKFYVKSGCKNRNVYKLGCIGNFIKIKDQITLIKSIHFLIKKGYSNINLVLIGSGPTLGFCKKYVMDNQLQKNIKFLRELPHDELNEFYNSLNLFVLPSYYEALGCVYLEAFSCGVPFIAVKNQGIEELIPKPLRNKFLFEKENHLELARLIESQMNNPVVQSLNKDVSIDKLFSGYLYKIQNL